MNKKSDLKELVLWADIDTLKNEITAAIELGTDKVSGMLLPNNR